MTGPGDVAGVCDEDGQMNSNYQVLACERKEKWFECSVARKDVRGVRARRDEAQVKGLTMAKKLKPGMFVAVQDREDQEFDVPFIIGLTCDVGNGTCIVKEHTEREYVNGTRFDAGEAAVAIRWCDTDHVSHLPECAMRDQLVLEQQADAACMYAVM